MRGWMLALGVMLLLLAFPGSVAADDAVLGRIGEAVQPIHSSQVRMVEEDVYIKVYPTRCEVTATFRFRNDGPGTSILVGFPEGSLNGDEPGVDTTLHEFSATVDGQPVQVIREVGLQPDQNPRAYDYPSWLTWEMQFSAGQTREVRNTYWVTNSYDSQGWVETGYVMTTGSLWHGPIGRAKLTVELMDIRPSQLVGAFPGDFRFDGDLLVWEWQDIEPTTDLRLVANLRSPASYMLSGMDENLRWQLEQLDLLREPEQVLQRIAQLRQVVPADKTDAALTYLQAMAEEALGRTDAAIASWQRLLAMSGEPGSLVIPETNRVHSAWAAFGDALFHLGGHYQAQAMTAEMAQLYHWAREVTAIGPPYQPVCWSPFMARWLGRWLPADQLLREPPRLEVDLVPQTAQIWDFIVAITDLNADFSFYRSHMRVWYEQDGQLHHLIDTHQPELALQRPKHTANGQHIKLIFQHELNDVPPGVTLHYMVEAVDAAGNKVVDSGQRSIKDLEATDNADAEDDDAAAVDNQWLQWLVLVAVLGAYVASRRFRKST